MRLSRSVAIRVWATTGAILFVASLAQLLLLRWALRGQVAGPGVHPVPVGPFASISGPTLSRLLVAIWLPLAAGSVGSAILVRMIARRRTRVISRALLDVARGTIRTQLPDPPEIDFLDVKQAFETMSARLDEAMGRLARVDEHRRRLFADLAHEIATPTSAILGIVDTLARPDLCPREEDKARFLARLEGEAVRLGALLRDLKDLAHLDDPDVHFSLEPGDVGEIAREAAAAYESMRADEGGAALRTEIEAAPARVDRLRIEQVLVNLLGNARRHAPPAGTIALRVAREADRVRLVVEDSGPGVPDEALPDLGERLFRVDPSRERRTGGHGLGLSIVKAIVERHGGTVRYGRSSLGGLRVEVDVPALADGREGEKADAAQSP